MDHIPITALCNDSSDETKNPGETIKISTPEVQPHCMYCGGRSHYMENCIFYADTLISSLCKNSRTESVNPTSITTKISNPEIKPHCMYCGGRTHYLEDCTSYANFRNLLSNILHLHKYFPIEDLLEDNWKPKTNQVEYESDIWEHEIHGTHNEWDDSWDYDEFSHQCINFDEGDPFSETDIFEWNDYGTKDTFNLEPWEGDFDETDCISQHIRSILSNPTEYQIAFSSDPLESKALSGCQNKKLQYPYIDPLLTSPQSSLDNSAQSINSSIKTFPLDVQVDSILQLIYPKPINRKEIPQPPNKLLPISSQLNLTSGFPPYLNVPLKRGISPPIAKKNSKENKITLLQQSKHNPLKYYNKQIYTKYKPTEIIGPSTCPKNRSLCYIKQSIKYSKKPKNKLQQHFPHTANRLNSSIINNFFINLLKKMFIKSLKSDKQLSYSALDQDTFLHKHTGTKVNKGLKLNKDTGQNNVLCSKSTHIGFDFEQDNFVGTIPLQVFA